MPTINANIADYLIKIESLTNTNLQILKSLNDSLYTSKNHIYTEVNDTTYVIPSFMSLENRLNALQENFENLVNSPETGEAYFNFNGNTRSIEVRKYLQAPNSVKLSSVSSFDIKDNDILNDMLTPMPYINFNLPELPNDIVEVNVKKIIAKSNTFKSFLGNKFNNDTSNRPASITISYSDFNKYLYNFTKGLDYIEYDTIVKLPIRKNIGTGTYAIKRVISDHVDENLNEYFTLEMHNDLNTKYPEISDELSYKLFDESISKSLQIGDELTTFDGKCKFVITDIRTLTNTIVVKVVNGEFSNLVGTSSYDSGDYINELSKLRFYSSIDFDNDKHVKVPLEEDKYVYVAIAPINSRLNVQSSWGTGLLIDTYSLVNGSVDFKTYYDQNVKNIGDSLRELSTMFTAPITALSQEEFEFLTSQKPVINTNEIGVWQINTHLDETTTVKNIRSAYSIKKEAENNLSTVQIQIDNINDKLASLSFDNTTDERELFKNELASLNIEKQNYLETINNAINTISNSVNSAEVPIENAKYRIRGFYIPNFSVKNNIALNDHIIGIQVQYRYKSLNSTSIAPGNAKTISSTDGNSNYIYSDWNEMITKNKAKTVNYNAASGQYTYNYEPNNESKNEPSFNQIDIPITQGETVSIKLRVIYDFGQPYVNMTSAWSDVVNIEFPDEFIKNVPILSIIEENNNDITTNKFKNILKSEGINEHVSNKIIAQNVTYHHKTDNIACTEDNQIISLTNKLTAITNDIAYLKSNLVGTIEDCTLSVQIGSYTTNIYPDRDNNIVLEPYNSFKKVTTTTGDTKIGSWDVDLSQSPIKESNLLYSGTTNSSNISAYEFEDDVVSTMMNICISNTSDKAVKLYSLFPGNRDVVLNKSINRVVDKNNYCSGENGGVLLRYIGDNNVHKLQTQNQFLTFRINDIYTGEKLYTESAAVVSNGVQNINTIFNVDSLHSTAMVVYPYLTSAYGLCIESNENKSYRILNPGETITVPMYCAFVAKDLNSSIYKIISFDLRTSLYGDPINYSIKVTGKNAMHTAERVANSANMNTSTAQKTYSFLR